MHGYNLTFDPLKIKQSRASERNDQAHSLPIQNLDPGHKRFYRRHVSDYPLFSIYRIDVYAAILTVLVITIVHLSVGGILVAGICQHKINHNMDCNRNCLFILCVHFLSTLYLCSNECCLSCHSKWQRSIWMSIHCPFYK